jgi:hypothetical protein
MGSIATIKYVMRYLKMMLDNDSNNDTFLYKKRLVMDNSLQYDTGISYWNITMNSSHATIKIRIGNNVMLDYNPTFCRWYHSDDGLTWWALPIKIKRVETAIAYVANHYYILAENLYK